MVRDEADLLPRWIDYYGQQFGLQNLIVLDDNSVDGSTDNLPCTLYRLPPAPWKKGWGNTRTRLVNGMAHGLLACNDVVIFTDLDEFLVPDPAKYSGLVDYLAERSDRPVIAPLALEVMHNARLEPVLDPSRPLLEQRRFVKFAPGMCKPLVKRTPDAWQGAFHAIHAPFEIDPGLWMLHLKYCDETVLQKVAEHRRRVHEVEGRGSPGSFWPNGPELLKTLLSSSTDMANGSGSVPEFDAAEFDLGDLVRKQGNGSWKSMANQVTALDTSPLRELPARFRSAF
ncbi:MAG TPA: glycosyltransferase family 2 protein [Nocardioidaceae bacterium]|nr:glycosyltransferase family 2 protein [Nocardioidaceae bacterium]